MNDLNEMRPALSVRREGERELIITRRFDASARKVFDALTRPEHVSQ